jgi:hypothetical protein
LRLGGQQSDLYRKWASKQFFDRGILRIIKRITSSK